MWPFKKKSLNFIGDFQPISRTSLFTYFGISRHQFQNLYEIQQNNNLLIYYFNNIAEVAAPVLKYVDPASQVKFNCNIPEVEKLLSKPNSYQSWDELFSLAVLHKRLLGNAIFNGMSGVDLKTSRNMPKQLYLLSPQFVSIIVSQERDWRLTKIQKYIFDSREVNREILEIDPISILHLKESNPNFNNNQFYFGESRYCSCSKNIECITSAYNTKANLYDGPQLIITGKQQGEFAAANQSENIKMVQEAMKKYGNKPGQYKNIITDIPLDVFKASFNVAELQLNENTRADFNRLCDAQNIDSKVFSDSTNATYANKQEAEKAFYTISFKSEIDSMFKDLENWLKTWWSGLELTPDYSGIHQITEASITENQRLLEDCKLGLMTRNQYNEATGRDIVQLSEFNEYRVYIPNSGWILNQNLNQNGQNNNGI